MGSSATARTAEAPEEGEQGGSGLTGVLEELDRLRRENRSMAVSLGAFSAFIASKGLLEEAWNYVHGIHQLEDGHG